MMNQNHEDWEERYQRRQEVRRVWQTPIVLSWLGILTCMVISRLPLLPRYLQSGTTSTQEFTKSSLRKERSSKIPALLQTRIDTSMRVNGATPAQERFSLRPIQTLFAANERDAYINSWAAQAKISARSDLTSHGVVVDTELADSGRDCGSISGGRIQRRQRHRHRTSQ